MAINTGTKRLWRRKQNRMAKRRRVSYGRRYTRGRFGANRTSYSGQSAAGNSKLWMRKKPFSKKAYGRKLFNASSDATKYRSALTVHGPEVAPSNPGVSLIEVKSGLPTDFQLVSGGSTRGTFTTTATMADKVFVRGGTLRIEITNDPGDAENLVPIRVRIWYGWTKQSTFGTLGTVFDSNTLTSMWDPTLVADWQTYIRISDYIEKTLLISDSLTWEHRLRPFQYDASTAGLGRYNLPVYIISVNGMAQTTSGTTFTTVRGHNVSYTADAV